MYRIFKDFSGTRGRIVTSIPTCISRWYFRPRSNPSPGLFEQAVERHPALAAPVGGVHLEREDLQRVRGGVVDEDTLADAYLVHGARKIATSCPAWKTERNQNEWTIPLDWLNRSF